MLARDNKHPTSLSMIVWNLNDVKYTKQTVSGKIWHHKINNKCYDKRQTTKSKMAAISQVIAPPVGLKGNQEEWTVIAPTTKTVTKSAAK